MTFKIKTFSLRTYGGLDYLVQAGASSLENSLGVLAHLVSLFSDGARNNFGVTVSWDLTSEPDEAVGLNALGLRKALMNASQGVSRIMDLRKGQWG